MIQPFKKNLVWILVILIINFAGIQGFCQTSKEKVVNFAWTEELTTLDPQKHMDVTAFFIHRHMFDPLIERTEDGSLKPMLASEWKYENDRLLILKLRDDVKFHNGEEFTSEAVKFTINRIKNPENASPQANLWEYIEKVETPDKYTVEIHLSQPYGPLLINLNLLEILPLSAENNPSFSEHPIGSGPFKFVEWVRGSHITMERNENYWGNTPKVDKIVYKEYPETATRITALEVGELQIVKGIPQEEMKRLEEHGIKIISVPSFQVRSLWMNSRRKPFDDERVRQAVWYGIDVESIVKYVMGEELAQVADAPLPPGVFGRTEKLSPYPYDPVKAKKLLEEAGYPNGFKTTILLSEIHAKQREAAQAVAAQLAEIGIEAEVIVQDRSVWVENFTKENYDTLLSGTTTLTGDADFTLARLYISESSFVGYHGDDELDSFLLKARSESDLKVRQELYERAQEIMWQRAAAIWPFHDKEAYGINPNVVGFEPRPDGYILLRDVELLN